jgi:hypothetical protein
VLETKIGVPALDDIRRSVFEKFQELVRQGRAISTWAELAAVM